MKQLKDIKYHAGSIKEQIIADAVSSSDNHDDQIVYIRDIAKYGCIGGSCRNLIYYADTHAFYAKYADEIDEILQDVNDNGIMENIAIKDTNGDLRNYLAWLAYEVKAQEIMDELETEDITK